MKKKVLAFLLMMVMILSMTACGSLGKRPTVEDVMNSFAEAEPNSITYEILMEISGETFAFKIDGGYDENKNIYASILAKFTMGSYKMDDYYELTNMYVVNDETMYIDIAQVMDFLEKLDGQFAMLTSSFELPGEYLVCTEKEFIAMCNELAGEAGVNVMDVEVNVVNIPPDELELEAMEISKAFLEDFAKAASGVATEVQKDKFRLVINNDNLGKVLGCFSDMDFQKHYVKYIDWLEKSGTVSEKQIMKYREMTADVNNAFAAAEAQYEENKESVGYLEMLFEFGVQNQNQYINAGLESDAFNFEISYKGKSDMIQNFSLPADTMTADEFVQMFYDYGLM